MPSPPADGPRLFFALWPPPATRDALAAWSRAHAPHRSRPARAENLHRTLAFLGNVPEARLDAVHAVGASVHAAPTALTLTRVEHWPRPRLLCALPAPGPGPLAALVASLRDALAEARLPVETRPFLAHVTLVRKVGRAWPAAALPEPLPWPAERLVLVRSESTDGGVRYRELAGWPLRA